MVDEKIYRNIHESDVVLILLTPDCFLFSDSKQIVGNDSKEEKETNYFIEEIKYTLRIGKPIITIITQQFKEKNGFPDGIPISLRKQLSRIQGEHIYDELLEQCLTNVKTRILLLNEDIFIPELIFYRFKGTYIK